MTQLAAEQRIVDEEDVIWWPQPGPQQNLIECPLPDILFGGARGGGKTDGVIGRWVGRAGDYGAGFNAVMFRRTAPSQDDAWERARDICGLLGAQVLEHTKTIRMPGGGRIRFRTIETVGDADKYQGQNLTDIWVEEAGQYPSPAPLDRLFGAMRSPEGVPVQMILTANPGGAGQQWIKRRYIDPHPAGNRILRRRLPNGAEHAYCYIPSRLQDNRALLDADPEYVNRLYLVGSEALVRAWLEGDWNAVEGAFFSEWSTARHVVPPFQIPEHWMRFRSMDWGSAAPFSVDWWAVASEDVTLPSGQRIPRGCMVLYREWYGKGEKLHAEQVAEGIVSRETLEDGTREKIAYGVLDPSAFAEDGGPSIAERMHMAGVTWRPGDNKRVSVAGKTATGSGGAMGGWDQMRARLRGGIYREGEPYPDPMLVVWDTCHDIIRTLPTLQHDPDKAEDLDTASEDHAVDSARYACMSRPFVIRSPQPEQSLVDVRPPTLRDMMRQVQASRGRRSRI